MSNNNGFIFCRCAMKEENIIAIMYRSNSILKIKEETLFMKKINQELLFERQQRITDTMLGRKTDRTPLLFSGDSIMMRYIDSAVTYKDMVTRHEELMQRVIDEFLPQFPKVDFLQAVGMNARNMGAGMMAKTLLPGRDLPDNEIWQLRFEHIMLETDYDIILKSGWRAFSQSCMFERMEYDPDSIQEDVEAKKRNAYRLHDAGFPFQMGGMLPATFDLLAFGRGIGDFYMDLYDYEEEIEEILNIMLEELEEDFAPQIAKTAQEAKKHGEQVFYAVQPAVQANAGLVHREIFERFAWPSYKRLADMVLQNGANVYFHMDGEWTPYLDYFKDFPGGRCIFDTDGGTDLTKVRDILGGTMAFTGSIPPSVMAFGTPDENYTLVKRQITEMGNSFIAAPSCTLPPNMPKENLQAFYAAVDEQ